MIIAFIFRKHNTAEEFHPQRVAEMARWCICKPEFEAINLYFSASITTTSGSYKYDNALVIFGNIGLENDNGLSASSYCPSAKFSNFV